MSKNDDTQKAARALETAARDFAKHSGPGSTASERELFSRDLQISAIRYARAYYAEARELGLIPSCPSCGVRGHDSRDHEADHE